MVVLEVCVEGPQGVRAARAGGAERVELCCALEQGGLTPSHGSIASSVAAGGVEFTVLVRPRAGDFVYSEEEIAWMERDIDLARELGAQGVALGCLTAEGEIDEARCARLLDRARGLHPAFHRAFDSVRAPEQALETLVRLGFARVLSSGQETSALEGRARLAALVRSAGGRIEVVAAGGVRPENAAEILRSTGVPALHFAARVRRPSRARHANPRVRLASGARIPDDPDSWETDEALVRAMVECVRRTR